MISPRQRARRAIADLRTGRYLNAYPYADLPITRRSAPEGPWAVHLADAAGRYQLLAFDLDESRGGAEVVQEDLALLRAWLDAAEAQYVVCASGPGAGRHVWAALQHGAVAADVAALARAAAARLPSLDIAPLTNPRTGAVRPPGAPHRNGGHSEVLTGATASLTAPRQTGQDLIERLTAILAPLAEEQHLTLRAGLQSIDEEGHPYLAGHRRGLSATGRASAHDQLGGDDASTRLWRVLLAAARARWQLQHVRAELASAPGLEHVRTSRGCDTCLAGRRSCPHPGARSPRTADEADELLARQWARAVAAVDGSRLEGSPCADEEWQQRELDVLALVEDIQAHADSDPRRWARRGGRTLRKTLDVLCAVHLEAVAQDVELDTRRLAQRIGMGREAARTALQVLAAEGWITCTVPAAGRAAPRWRLDKRPAQHASSELPPCNRAQGNPPPRAPTPSSLRRQAWTARLTHRADHTVHDCWAPYTGLGSTAAALWSTLHSEGQLDQAAARLGLEPGLARRLADTLVTHGLGRKTGLASWEPIQTARHGADPRDVVADQLGLTGRLIRRRQTHAVERTVWAWWIEEVGWLRSPRSQRPPSSRRRRPGPGQTQLPVPGPATLRGQLGRYPRGPRGQPDHRRARELAAQLLHQPQAQGVVIAAA